MKHVKAKTTKKIAAKKHRKQGKPKKQKLRKHKVVTVLGTRPEIIKLSPLLPKLDKVFDHIIIHTGQHYSTRMSEIFFKDLNLRVPDYNISVGSGSQAYQTGNMLVRIEEILLKEKPSIVIVQGDTNSTFAGAFVAGRLNIKVVHVEAGARSWNREMPEELNRILTDHISDLLFAYDPESKQNLLKEGIPKEKICQIFNTSFEACKRNIVLAKKSGIMKKLALKKDSYILVTIHRAENTNSKKRLSSILGAINKLAENHFIVFPMHPGTWKLAKKFGIKISRKIILTKPLGHIDFLKLLDNCICVMTDSGGIQDEAVTFNKPIFQVRNYIERERLVKKGKMVLVTTEKKRIISLMRRYLDKGELEKIRKNRFEADYHVSDFVISKIKTLCTLR